MALLRDELENRFGLTRQEARVLAERMSNTEIARELSIGSFTARRHPAGHRDAGGVRKLGQVASGLVRVTEG